MAEFNYLAIDVQGRRVKGRCLSETSLQAEQVLLGMGLMPLKLTKVWWYNWRPTSTASKQELIFFTHQLAYLLKANVPLMDILSDMQQTANRDFPQLQSIIRDLHRQIGAGTALSRALSAYPDLFDGVYVGVLLAGEQSGQLDQVLLSLHERLVWQSTMEQRVKRLMTYPSLVLLVILTVTGVLVTQLVPQLLSFLQANDKPLSGMTYSLMWVSDGLRNHGLWLLGGFLLIWQGWRLALKQFLSLRCWQDQYVLSMGLIGRIYASLAIMRMTKVMALLYMAGVSFHPLLGMTRQVVGNLYLAQQLERVEQSIMSGQSLAQSFEQTQAFPNMMIQLIRIGEKSGQLDQRLQDISLHYQQEVDRLLAQLEPWIEPMITLLLALLLGWVLMATIMPIYEAIG